MSVNMCVCTLRNIYQTHICMGACIHTYVNKQKVYYILINRKSLTWRQAFAIHAEWLHQVWWIMLFSTILLVLDGTSVKICTCCWYSCRFLILSSWVLSRTPSKMCGRLYLTMFLLRVGFFILIIIHSLIVLAMFCPSIPQCWSCPV